MENEDGARNNETFRKIKVLEYSSKNIKIHIVVSLLKFMSHTLFSSW